MATKKAIHPIIQTRPPVIVIMGHVDHGKSTLLDYIRHTNVVAGEAGGITQHVSAYEIEHAQKRITFLDTPGHSAFSAMRSRGAAVADIAVLVVAADDSVKAQTLEAKKAILDAGIPFIVAINKIDKPGANPMKVKQDLAENEILVEGYGGNISCVEISAKDGTGVPELLDMMLLIAELEELTGDETGPVEGVVIESRKDPKRGATATILIKNGTLERGSYVCAGTACAPVRILEDFAGTAISSATFSSPVLIAGFSTAPDVGSPIVVSANKKDASRVEQHTQAPEEQETTEHGTEKRRVPVLLKSDAVGTLEAIVSQIEAMGDELVNADIINQGVGEISENDINSIAAGDEPIVVGFNVKIDSRAKDVAQRRGLSPHIFTIIYELTEYVAEELEKRRPRLFEEVPIGTAKVLKLFGRNKEKQIIGGVVTKGMIRNKMVARVIRNESEVARATILEIQHGKQPVDEVETDLQFGMQLTSRLSIAEGDYLEVLEKVER
ncbi:MAG: translation initiation factor IF-2 [bacterium]|nr:translation initiation factor IF-2 [bacterium]